METKANYPLIGALVLGALAAILAFVLWLGQSQFRQDFKLYDIVFEGPISLEEGSAVRYIGIKVGEVSWVRIDRNDPSKARARVRIDRETPVREDSMASIQLAGITGITFVQISAGKGNALEARPGQPVPVIRSERTPLDELFAGSAAMLGKADNAISRVNDVLTEDNINSISATIRNLESITSDMAGDTGLVAKATQTMVDVSSASVAFETASRDLGKFGATADTEIVKFGTEMSTLVTDLRGVVDSTNKTVLESQKTVAAATAAIEGPAANTLEDARMATQDLRVLISRLDRMSREIEQNPQGLIVGEPVPYEEKR